MCMTEHLRLVPPLKPTSAAAQVDGASANEVSADCSELLNGADRSRGLHRQGPGVRQRYAARGINPGRCDALLFYPS